MVSAISPLAGMSLKGEKVDLAGSLLAGRDAYQGSQLNQQAIKQNDQQIARADYEQGVERLKLINRLAVKVKQLPQDQRGGFVQSLNQDMLKSVGIDPAQISGVQLDDQSLDALIAQTGAAMDESGMNEYQRESLRMEQEKLNLNRDKFNSPNAGEPSTSKEREWDRYQELLRSDPAAAEQFARAAGFSSREGEKLSAFAEKQIDAAFGEYSEAASNTSRYTGLADALRQSSMGGGLSSSWGEWVKEQTGNQDEITALRKEAKQIANNEGIKNLPPGPATDRDIEIVMSPFPSEKANPEYIANWLEAMSRLNQKRAEYAEFKADFISKNGSMRTRGGQSLIAAWKEMQGGGQSANQGGSGQGAMTPGIAPSAVTSKYKVEVMD